jgi:hypothetical protein
MSFDLLVGPLRRALATPLRRRCSGAALDDFAILNGLAIQRLVADHNVDVFADLYAQTAGFHRDTGRR